VNTRSGLKESATLIRRDIRGIREDRYLTCGGEKRIADRVKKRKKKLHPALD